MVFVMRNEEFCPETYAFIEGLSDGLVWEKESDAPRADGGDMVAIDECKGMCDA